MKLLRCRSLFAFVLGLLVALPLAYFLPKHDLLLTSEANASSDEAMPLHLFADLSREVNPAVVNISTTQIIRTPQYPFGGGGMGPGLPFDPFRDFFFGFNAPPQAEKVQSLGSGFIIDPDGLIITNNHVIAHANQIDVQLTEKSKKTYRAKVVGADARADIALIKITTDKKLTAVKLGDSDKVDVGEWVAAFGNPLGHGHSETKGIISATDREIEIEGSSYAFIQTDASINPGNSGGPLVNTSGEVIGVNAAIDARGQGIGFAIPINIVKKLLPQLKTKGRVARAFLGVAVRDISDEMVKQFKLKDTEGAIVLQVQPGSPAEKAGLRPYDVILKVNDKSIDSSRALTNVIGDAPVGSTVTIKLIREGKQISLKAKLQEAPNTETAERREPALPHGVASTKLGVRITDLTPEIARELKLPPQTPKHGVLIVEVREGSLAEQAGLQPGDIILDINQRHVAKAKDVEKALDKSGKAAINMRVLRRGVPMLVFMEASSDSDSGGN